MKRALVLTVIFGLIVGATVPALAAGPPSAVLIAGEGRQEGSLKAYCWSDGVSGTCAQQTYYSFPKEVLNASGSASILFKKPEPPEAISIRYWTRIQRTEIGRRWFDRPRGQARTLQAELEPLVTSEGLQWQATFEPPDGKTIFLALRAGWSLDASCPACDQWATWAFSLR